MFQAAKSNSTLSEEASNTLSSFNPLLLQNTSNIITSQQHQQQQPSTPKKIKKKRSLPGNPDPDAEVIALSPKTLLARNRFICEICNKGFQRDQNLQLHRRGHNLPWKLKQRNKNEIVRKKAYVCPETSCVHHHPSRALGDLTGIKKHFCRKHGEKKYKCEKCFKIYAVQSDWKAHSKTCGTREYKCDCGTLFSRKDSFITHRAFCDALAEESARLSTNPNSCLFPFTSQSSSISLSSSPWDPQNPLMHIKTETHQFSPPPNFFTNHSATTAAPFLSATIGTVGTNVTNPSMSAMLTGFDELSALSRHIGPPTTAVLPPQPPSTTTTTTTNHRHSDEFSAMLATLRKNNNDDGLTRDFLGLTAADEVVGNMLKFTSGLHYAITAAYDRDNSSSSSILLKPQHHQNVEGFGFTEPPTTVTAVSGARWG